MIISLVRDIMRRDISDVFENWDWHFKNIENPTIENTLEILQKEDHTFSLNWFDTEFKEYTGIDIYEFPFNKTEGYSIYRTPKYDILIIQLEKLSNIYKKAFKEFCGINIPHLKSFNQSENKKFKHLYNQTLIEFSPGKAILDLVYHSKCMNHFYSP